MKIAIVHNLPSGGGLRMLESIIQRYKNIVDIDIFVIGEKEPKEISGVNNTFIKVKPWKGFFLYNFWILSILPLIHKRISKQYKWRKYSFVLFTHDYFTKSPYLLRFIDTKNKYYLCQEPQREFYEPISYHASSLKEIAINILRYPIKLIDELNVSSSTKLFCNSKYSKMVLSKIYKKKFEIIYPGVNQKYFYPLRKIKKEDIILCVGGINKTKNQEFIIKSLSPLLDKYKLILVGDGKKEYKEKIISFNKNIKIMTHVNDQKLRNYYRKAKFTCISAYKEPFGLSSIESQSCGTPVLTVTGGGSVETIINGRSGYISEMDESDFYQKAKKILNRNTIMSIESRKNILNHWTNDITLKPLDKYFNENLSH